MRISGTEPLSVILCQTNLFEKFKSDALKVQKQTKSNANSVIKPQNYDFNTEKFDALQNATNQPKSTVELGYLCHRGLTCPLAVELRTVMDIILPLLMGFNSASFHIIEHLIHPTAKLHVDVYREFTLKNF